LKKQKTEYTLQETKSDTMNILKNNKYVGCGVLGEESALEAIFVFEKMTKKDWLICEDGVVFLVDREEHKKGIYDESK